MAKKLPLWLITFDLKSTAHDYRPFYAQLNRMGAKQIMTSAWVIRSEDRYTIYDALQILLHYDDILLISVLTMWSSKGIQGEL